MRVLAITFAVLVLGSSTSFAGCNHFQSAGGQSKAVVAGGQTPVPVVLPKDKTKG